MRYKSTGMETEPLLPPSRPKVGTSRVSKRFAFLLGPGFGSIFILWIGSWIADSLSFEPVLMDSEPELSPAEYRD